MSARRRRGSSKSSARRWPVVEMLERDLEEEVGRRLEVEGDGVRREARGTLVRGLEALGEERRGSRASLRSLFVVVGSSSSSRREEDDAEAALLDGKEESLRCRLAEGDRASLWRRFLLPSSAARRR